MLRFGADTDAVAREPPRREPRSASSCSTTSTTRAARSCSTPTAPWAAPVTTAAHCRSAPAPTAQYFLNFDANDGRARHRLRRVRRPNGTCLHARRRSSDGNDVDLRRPRQRLARRRHRPGHAVRRLGQRPAQRRRRPVDGDDRRRARSSWPNDAPDTHPIYEDRAYGGAGLDVLIGNTGGDRLIDWVGEFNSYLVPFAPFGIATVSRQIRAAAARVPLRAVAQPGRRPDARDRRPAPTPAAQRRAATASSAWSRQQDHGLLAGPDRRPDRPAGRATSRAASATSSAAPTSTTARCRRFAVDSGVVDGHERRAAGRGRLARPGRGRGLLRRRLPAGLLRDRRRRSSMQKPTGGWKANAYIIFDYFVADRLQVRRHRHRRPTSS